MTTDLRYAMRQVAMCREASHAGRLDCIQRAMDALERCVERAAELEAIAADAEYQEQFDGDMAAKPTLCGARL